MNYQNWINNAEILYKQNISFTEIGKRLNINRKLVSYYLQKKGYIPNHKFMPKEKVIQKTQKYVNENVFEKIDSEEKAYWLGFMYADGCVSEKTNRIELCVQEKDKEHIIKFKTFLKSQHKIGKKIKNNKYISYRLGITREKLKKDLIKQGCIPNKTKVMKFPTKNQVPKKFIFPFIRGYFDADGCIRKHNTSNVSLELLGYEDFLKELTKLLNIDGHIYSFNHSDVSRFMIAGKQATEIFNYLYKDATIYLDRKYKKYLKLCRLEPKLQKTQDD